MRTLRKIIGVIFYLIAAVALILAFFCLVEGFKSSNWFGGIAAAVIVIIVALAAFVIGWYIANPGEWEKRTIRHRRKRPTLSPRKRQPHKGMSKRRDFNPLSKINTTSRSLSRNSCFTGSNQGRTKAAGERLRERAGRIRSEDRGQDQRFRIAHRDRRRLVYRKGLCIRPQAGTQDEGRPGDTATGLPAQRQIEERADP